MIPNQWYPILEAKEVGNGKPTGVRRMGEELVLWRDLDGNLVCQGARCPHKGANLADGRMKGNTVECPYHGFRYGPDGACKAVPALGSGARIPGSLRVPTHPVREAHGLVWLWWGEERAEADLPDLQIAPVVADNPKAHATTHWTRPVHYTRYIESLLEFYHITYVHRDHWFNYIDYLFLYGTARKLGLDGKERYLAATKIVNHKLETEGQTLRYSFDHQEEADPRNTTHYVITFTFPCQVHVQTEQFEATSWLVPVDDGHTEHILRWYEYPAFKPLLRAEKLRRVLPWASLYMEKWIQDVQDVRIMERQEPKISEGGVSKFIPVDELNAKYLAIRSRLIQEAAAKAPPAGETAEAAGPPAGRPAPANGRKAAGAAANGNGSGGGNGSGSGNGSGTAATVPASRAR
ncbi:aromatic ring-hydroxylating oxygenase subunit alpha [Streptomyces telluris]|uniref:Aromatic ring-hydroxylating dioxygenase subunit alpha n=1 Tax=Streptomyces telluris TaxID=2720021 RepID=A0A9X2LDW8_9ACTN|nr:aromatic ring-hydroxylating dioxygenase subunit alpha [Streptomyces telluris]MCQ8769401.1 aromatic ring-hydroxylating dioxygenase subunit alpha [Streptomyces telluris]NJP77952.1 aromatic ring-hydroxylating dioxygenase subunit alpha [Streptomyces telluris]